MGRSHHIKRRPSLAEKYPPSEPCNCAQCLSFCRRPGWWTVVEAEGALAAGLGGRMMLEFAPDLTFGVLSPAFYGCEGGIAVNEFRNNGCNFLKGGRCELYRTAWMPLECRFCHHSRPGQGPKCHADLEQDWHTPAGQGLVAQWIKTCFVRTGVALLP
jgi:hypothetical protein